MNGTVTGSSAKEAEILRSALAAAPRTVLVASDLHLSAGRDLATGAFHLTENFLADDAFARWLAHHRASSPDHTLLVLNGDIFDFVRVHCCPQATEDFDLWAERLARLGQPRPRGDLQTDITRSERRYGLRTHDYKSVWKLLAIVRSHEAFFDALAAWIAAGNGLLMTAGNHDVELRWPLIRQALRDELVRRAAPQAVPETRVAFADGGFSLGNLYVEHGHQYEPMTRVDGNWVLDRDPTQVTLPLGSLVNRYFINPIERLNPFIDNVRPVNAALLALLRKYPASIIGTYVRAWRFLLRAVQAKRLRNGAVLTVLVALLVPLVTVAVLIAAQVWPALGARLSLLTGPRGLMAAAFGGMLFPVLLPYLLGVLGQIRRELLRILGVRTGDHLVRATPHALALAFPPPGAYRRVYAVMGHTHAQTVLRLAATPREEFYVNCGTWTAIWPSDRPDLAGAVLNGYARFDRASNGEYRHSACIWDDRAKEPRPAPILVSAS